MSPLSPLQRQFDNLDEGVQAEFESFLDERGINSSLALFIPDLAEYKYVLLQVHRVS